MASRSSYSPEKSDSSSSWPTPAVEGGHRLGQLLGQALVGGTAGRRLLDQLEQDPGVGEVGLEPVEALHVVGDPSQLGGDRPGPVGVVPQVGTAGLGLQLGAPRPAARRVRRYCSASPSRAARSSRSAAKSRGSPAPAASGGAMAELELLAAPAPARVVAPDLLLGRLDHRHQGVVVDRRAPRPVAPPVAAPLGGRGRRGPRRPGPAAAGAGAGAVASPRSVPATPTPWSARS